MPVAMPETVCLYLQRLAGCCACRYRIYNTADNSEAARDSECYVSSAVRPPAQAPTR
eukprot:IDg18995t1